LQVKPYVIQISSDCTTCDVLQVKPYVIQISSDCTTCDVLQVKHFIVMKTIISKLQHASKSVSLL
jgi:hypothetical protein